MFHLHILSGSTTLKIMEFKTEEAAERAATALVGTESHGGQVIDAILCYDYIKEFGLSTLLWELEH